MDSTHKKPSKVLSKADFDALERRVTDTLGSTRIQDKQMRVEAHSVVAHQP